MHQPRAPGSAVEYGTNPIRNTAVFSLLEQAEKVLSTVLSGAPDANLAFDDLRRLHLTLTPQSGSAETYGANCVTSMSAKYEILIYWSEEDHAYLAEVPELPGCMADGDIPLSSEIFVEEAGITG